MSASAIVIVGAGIMGASAAYHLARAGWRDLLILDRSPSAGEGSTGKATGGFRAQFETEVNVRLSLLSRRKLLEFRDEIGTDPGYQAAGYLWLAASAAQMEALRQARCVQHACGLREAVEVGVEDAARLNPALRLDGIVGGAFCPSDGFLRPLAMLQGYLEAAQRKGVRVEWGTEVTGFDRDASGRVVAVRTSRGRIAVDTVVNAAGPWAAAIMEAAGLALPVVPLRRQVAATFPCDLLPAAMPMSIFLEDGFHLRVRDGRVLLLWPTPGAPGRPYETSVEADWIYGVLAKAQARVPVLRSAAIDVDRCWAGLYEMSPDRHAILGAAPDCPNLYLINGSSGHGVMHAPALGALLAEIVTDGTASTLNVDALRPGRFAEGRPNPASELL